MEWAGAYIIISILALGISIITLLIRTAEKSLSIREFEAYAEAVSRDIHRVEGRLMHLEQTRPTTGELQILSDSFNKRLDEIRDERRN